MPVESGVGHHTFPAEYGAHRLGAQAIALGGLLHGEGEATVDSDPNGRGHTVRLSGTQAGAYVHSVMSDMNNASDSFLSGMSVLSRAFFTSPYYVRF